MHGPKETTQKLGQLLDQLLEDGADKDHLIKALQSLYWAEVVTPSSVRLDEQVIRALAEIIVILASQSGYRFRFELESMAELN